MTRLYLLSGLSLFHNVMDLGLASKYTGVGQMFMIQILSYSYTLLFFVYDFDHNGSFWAAVPLLRQTGSPRLLALRQLLSQLACSEPPNSSDPQLLGSCDYRCVFLLLASI